MVFSLRGRGLKELLHAKPARSAACPGGKPSLRRTRTAYRGSRYLPKSKSSRGPTRPFVHAFDRWREKLELSPTVVAARMGTSPSAPAGLEAGDVDPRTSTVERYAVVLGEELSLRRSRPPYGRSAGPCVPDPAASVSADVSTAADSHNATSGVTLA